MLGRVFEELFIGEHLEINIGFLAKYRVAVDCAGPPIRRVHKAFR